MIICKTFTFDAGHRLMNYQGACSNIHGHTYKLEVMIEGRIITDDMVIDFKELKAIVNEFIIDRFDHALLLNQQDKELIELCEKCGYKYFIFDSNPTAEIMATFIHSQLPYSCRIRLWETPTSYAEVGDDIC
jgi:6-pyruvoyltetrahydropterin/6-carboxytetrahydropterin synthase